MSGETHWIPLESNPEVMNKFLTNIGVPDSWRIHDVYGFESELLEMLPKPVLAVLLLFPINEKFENHFKKQVEEKEAEVITPSVYFMKQNIGNACGTIALIHAIANNLENVKLLDGSLKKFLEETKDLSADERAAKLQADVTLSSAHEQSAQEGQTQAPNPNENVNLHFIAFVEKAGSLYELDGRKPRPIPHGITSRETFMEDVAKVCRKLMAVDPEEINFTLVALAAAE